jgi:DNA mismatch repair protein MutS2
LEAAPLRNVGHVLVLMDELGGSTETDAGGAIAAAALEAIAGQRVVRVVATTHHDTVKRAALLSPLLESAAMGRNGDFTPNFALSYGSVGDSFALETAQRLGLAPAILARARQLLASDGGDGGGGGVGGGEGGHAAPFPSAVPSAVPSADAGRRAAGRRMMADLAEAVEEARRRRDRFEAMAALVEAERAEAAEINRKLEETLEEAAEVDSDVSKHYERSTYSLKTLLATALHTRHVSTRV